MATEKYDSSQLKHLSGAAAVRAKPTMYIGELGGLGKFTLLREVADNVVDEALGGHATLCHITVNADGTMSVRDNGRGIPTDPMTVKDAVSGKSYKIPGLQAVTSLLHAGGKLDADSLGYKVSRGAHGVGIKAANFLSEYFTVETYFNRTAQLIGYSRGELSTPMKQVKATQKGTRVEFKPDHKIFGSDPMPLSYLASWAMMASYFTPGLKIRIDVEKPNGDFKTTEFYSENGVSDFLTGRMTALECQPIFPAVDPFEFASPAVTCGFIYTNYGYSDMKGFTNGLENREGGEHVNAFFDALAKALTPYKNKATFGMAELKEGVVGVVNAILSSPQFSSQDKVKLVDARAKDLSPILTKALTDYFKKNPTLPKGIVERCVALQALKKKFTEDKTLLKSLKDKQRTGISIKVVMANNYPPDQRELYVVEGDSAAGTLRQVRLPYQELLPLKGKPVNTYGKMQETKMLANNEIQSLLTMVGFDIRNPDNWEPRVGKVIVAADNDDDGKHIAALLMAFFHKYAPRMLERNMVHIAVTPEYVIKAKSKVHFAYDHPTAIQLLTDHGGTMHHIKGLGELNKELLYESGVNPATRKLWRIMSNPDNDASRIVEILGESPEARKRLLGLA